ncbi:MAG: ImmA/IrrE family metallo-endopeptidase [Oscillospiraceae bacterium]|nr:ImmA/IrrE family metallo-endopeptidase [Oscillospiraceae bacterium]
MKLLEKLDIKVIPYDFSNLEKNDYKNQVIEKGIIWGAAVHSGDRIGLFYRQDDSEKRKRFTLAHELAHCCLHMDENTSEHIEFINDQANSNDEKEYDANVFAGELLIPEEPLRYALENLIMPKVEILAQIFGVSLNVMKARLKYLKISAYE